MVVGSPQAFGVAGTQSAALGFNGTRGPVPWRSRRTDLSALWARAPIYPSQSTLHNRRSRDLAQPSLSGDAKVPSATIRRPICSR